MEGENCIKLLISMNLNKLSRCITGHSSVQSLKYSEDDKDFNENHTSTRLGWFQLASMKNGVNDFDCKMMHKSLLCS